MVLTLNPRVLAIDRLETPAFHNPCICALCSSVTLRLCCAITSIICMLCKLERPRGPVALMVGIVLVCFVCVK